MSTDTWTVYEWGQEWRGADGWKIVRYANDGSLNIFTPYDDAEISIGDDGLYVFRGSTTGWTPKPSAVLIPLPVLREIVALMEVIESAKALVAAEGGAANLALAGGAS